eukprot:gene9267-biopygen21214
MPALRPRQCPVTLLPRAAPPPTLAPKIAASQAGLDAQAIGNALYRAHGHVSESSTFENHSPSDAVHPNSDGNPAGGRNKKPGTLARKVGHRFFSVPFPPRYRTKSRVFGVCGLSSSHQLSVCSINSESANSFVAPQAPPEDKISGNVAPQAPPGLATGLQRTHSPHRHSGYQPSVALDTRPGPTFDGPNCW